MTWGSPSCAHARASCSRPMTHLLKLHAWPASRSAPHRRDEAGAFLDDAARRLTASMRQRIGLDDLYAKALRRAAAATDDAGAPRAMPGGCPFTLDGLLAGELDALLAAADRRGAG